MSYLDSSDAALIALTRQRRAEASGRKATIYYRVHEPMNADRRRKRVPSAQAYPNPQHHFWQSRSRVRPLAGESSPGTEHPRAPWWRMFKAQDGCCYLCGWRFREDHWATEDHVLPRSRGGANRANVALAHQGCNTWKGNRKPYPCEVLALASINERLEWIAWETRSFDRHLSAVEGAQFQPTEGAEDIAPARRSP